MYLYKYIDARHNLEILEWIWPPTIEEKNKKTNASLEMTQLFTTSRNYDDFEMTRCKGV